MIIVDDQISAIIFNLSASIIHRHRLVRGHQDRLGLLARDPEAEVALNVGQLGDLPERSLEAIDFRFLI